MSYLLEALQKSQKDRDQQLPNLQTPALQIEVPDEAPRSPWIYIAIAALAINTVVIVYLLLKPRSDNAAIEKPVAEQQVTTAAPVVEQKQMPKPESVSANIKDRIVVQEVEDVPLSSNTHNNVEPTLNPVHEAAAALPTIKAVNTASDFDLNSVPEVYQLPLELRNQIPAMEMNSHIYAPNPADSFVMINNTSLTPGAQLTPELKLLAVTPDGAILQFQDSKFLLPALKSFQP